MEEVKKARAHIRYKNKNGKIVPGVTTILSVLNKPALIPWANNLGLKGIDCTRYRDSMADIGTIAHLMILEHLSGVKQDLSEYSRADIDKAENCLISFFEWEKTNRISPILVEEPLVSEDHQFGGTIDCYGDLDGKLTLIDFKTSKAIYPEMVYQVAAYRKLLVENGLEVERVRILRIGRSQDEGFEDRLCSRIEDHWKIFSHCLGIYNLRKKINK
jgi:hypothetical protein